MPVIAQVQRSLGRGGRLYVGDCKMAALDPRAFVAATDDHYLCPLSAVQVPAAELERLLEPVWDAVSSGSSSKCIGPVLVLYRGPALR